MSDVPIHERRFSDEEVREILAKAVERTPSKALSKREGLSLADLKAIGEEVGIDPLQVEDAARAVTLQRSHHPHALLGGPTRLDFERQVPGRVDPQDIPEIISLIRRTMGVHGDVSEVHGAIEWSTTGEVGERLVTLSERDGVTTIRGSANLTSAAVVTYLPAGLVGSIISLIGLIRFAKAGSELALIVALIALPILYPVLRSIYRRFSGSEEENLSRVVDELASRVEASEEVET